MGNIRNGKEAKQRRKEDADDRHEAWEKLNPVQKLQKLVDNGHGHTKLAKQLKQAILDARIARGGV